MPQYWDLYLLIIVVVFFAVCPRKWKALVAYTGVCFFGTYWIVLAAWLSQP